jgi:hypothetical protein
MIVLSALGDGCTFPVRASRVNTYPARDIQTLLVAGGAPLEDSM